jgi:photosystem II stability/assembly factor-like uncharacterized protein
MTRTPAFTLLFMFAFTVAGDEWFYRSPTPDLSRIQGVFQLSSDTLVLLGSDGKLSMSTDMGLTWDNTPKRFLGDITCAEMYSFDGDNIRFFLERTSMYYLSTINIHSSRLDTVRIRKTVPHDHFMLSPDSGWVVGNNDLVMKTKDGGVTWDSMPTGKSTAWRSAYFEDFNTGWIAGSKGNIAFTKNGRQWTFQTSGTTKQLNDILFVDDSTGFVIGDSGIVLKTDDRGLTWTLEQITAARTFSKIFFVDSTLIICSSAGTTYRSRDLGETWNTVGDSAMYNIKSMFFIDSSNGWLGMVGDLARTEDCGKSWEFLLKPVTRRTLRDVSAIDSNTAFATGDSGMIIFTRDGGSNWTVHQTDYTSRFYSIDFPTPAHGWVVGASAVILNTTDGGETWNEQECSFSSAYAFNTVDFYDKNTGFIAGSSGALLRTIDGGKNWETLKNPSGVNTTNYECIQMLNSETAFLGGNDGYLRKTNNGGDTWSKITLRTTSGITPTTESGSIVSVCFLDNQTGIVTSYSRCWYTSDGGNTWAFRSLSSSGVSSVSAALDTFFIVNNRRRTKVYRDFQEFSTVELDIADNAIDFKGNTGWMVGRKTAVPSAAVIMKIKLIDIPVSTSTAITPVKLTNKILYSKELPFTVVPLSPVEKAFTLSGRLVRDLKRPGSLAVIKKRPGSD